MGFRKEERLLPALALLTGALAVASVYSAYREVGPFVGHDADRTGLRKVVSVDHVTYGISSFSHELILKDCHAALMSVASTLLPANERLAKAATCEAIGLQILARNQASSYAALIVAYSSASLGRHNEMANYLKRSHALAPNELWLATLRVRLARDWPLLIEQTSMNTVSADMRTMGRTESGRRMLADWYLADVSIQNSITKAMEGLSSVDKQAFVDVLKSTAQ